jgi:hypothetical protein
MNVVDVVGVGDVMLMCGERVEKIVLGRLVCSTVSRRLPSELARVAVESSRNAASMIK